MAPSWLLYIHLFHIQCQFYTKQVILTPQNPNQQGAQVTILETDEVTATDTAWNIVTLDKVGCHMQLSLQPLIWGFYPSNTLASDISVTIDSNTPTPIESSLILSATVNNKYATTIIRLNNNQENKISPSCNPDEPPGDEFLVGDVAALVAVDNLDSRLWKATGNNQKANFADANSGKDMSFPITIQLHNEPEFSEMFFTVIATGWPNQFDQFCLFQKWDHSMGLDFYISLNNVGEVLNITSITVKYEHTGTGSPSLKPTSTSPTNSPTKMPSKNPTSSPTLNPTKIPSNIPTNIPSKSPTKIPTKIPSNIPSKNPTLNPTSTPTTSQPSQSPITRMPTYMPTIQPTYHPTNIPTHHPTSIPSVYPTVHPTIIPSTATITPTIYPTIFPTNIPTLQPTKYPTYSPSIAPTNAPSRPQGEVDAKTTQDIENGNQNEHNDALQRNEIFGIFGGHLIVYSMIGVIAILIVTCLICMCIFVKKRRRQKVIFDNDNNTVEMEKVSSISAQFENVVHSDNTQIEPATDINTNYMQTLTPMIGSETDNGNLLMLNDTNNNNNNNNNISLEEDENDEDINAMYASNRNLNKQITKGGDNDNIDNNNQSTKDGGYNSQSQHQTTAGN